MLLSAPLLHRRRELAHIRELIDEATARRSAALVVVGDPGIGKTALLDAVVAEAGTPLVVRTFGVEHADAPAYSGAARLCEPLRGHAPDLIPEQARVLAGALGWADPVSTDPFGVGASLLGLFGAAATDRGLVVLVDDADFLDRASLEALAFAAGRLGREGVVMVFASRPDSPALSHLDALDRLRLEGLDDRAARELLAARAPAPVDQHVADELVAAAAGNPLALSELVVALSPHQLAGRQPLPRPLPVGDRLPDALASRLAPLSEGERLALLVAAASFGDPRAVGDGLGRLGLDESALDTAERSGLIERSSGRVDFRIPLMRSAVYHDADPERRQAVHVALAEANAAAGELERQAWHLARAATGPDEATAEVIEDAARLARSRGGLPEAAAAFEAAAQSSVDPERRWDRFLSAAELWLMAGRTDLARGMAEHCLAHPVPGPTRARAVLVRGRALLIGTSEEEGRRYLMGEAQEVALSLPGPAASMAVAVSTSAMRSGLVAEALTAARSGVEWAGRVGDRLAVLAEITLASAEVATGDGRRRVWLVQAVKELISAGAVETGVPMVVANAGLALIWAEANEDARAVLDRMELAARRAQAPGVLPVVLITRGVLENRTAHWREGEAAAADGLVLAIQTGQTAVVPYAQVVLGTAEAVLGHAGSCRERCMALLETPAARIPTVRAAVLVDLGMLELSQGRYHEAARWFEVLTAGAGSPTADNPGIMMWGGDLGEAYVGMGQTERALRVADQLQERADVIGSARAAAAAKRIRAMVCDDDDEAEVLFAEALRYYGGPDLRFGRARIELARGVRLGRAGRRSDAERRLATALSLFDQMGAAGWAARTSAELEQLGVGSSGGRRLHPSLSPAEHRVAMAAAMGAEPRAIAGGLFLSEATVTAALDAALTKLGLSSAAELRDRLGDLVAMGGSLPAAATPAEGTSAPVRRVRPTVRLLGDCDVLVDGTVVVSPPGLVGQALKHVALAGRVPLEELVEELWPDAAPGAGRHRLRTLLTRLRRLVGPLVVRDGDWVRLADEVEADVTLFERAVGAAQAATASGDPHAERLARDALDLYRGELLPTDRHLSFTTGPRERLRRMYLSMTNVAVDAAVRRADVDTAVRFLERAITEDPHDEAPYLRAASLLADADRPREAAVVLRRARAALAELGVPPSAEAQDLERSLTRS